MRLLPGGMYPGPTGETYIIHCTNYDPQLHLGEEKGRRWKRKGGVEREKEKETEGERLCSSKNSFKILWSRSDKNNCHHDTCSHHRRRLLARCAIFVAIGQVIVMCGWSKTNALKPSAQTQNF